MLEFANYVLKVVGPPGLVLLFGVIADTISTQHLKQTVVGWLARHDGRRRRPKFGKEVLSLFLSGFLFRIFDKRFSWRFLGRSFLVSIGFLGLVLIVQSIYHKDVLQGIFSLGETVPQFLIVLGAILGLNLAIDFLSNVATVTLLRLAASSGRLFDTVLVCLADLSLTVVVFTLVFPVVMVGTVLALDQTRTSTTLVAQLVPPAFMFNAITDILPKVGEDQGLKLTLVDISQRSESQRNERQSERANTTIFVWSAPQQEAASTLREVATLVGSVARKVDVISATNDEARFNVYFNSSSVSLRWIRSLYYAAFIRGNVIRDSFLGVVQLEPISIAYRRLYDEAVDWEEAFTDSPNRVVAMCASGEVKSEEAKTLAKYVLPCQASTVVVFTQRAAPERQLRKVAFGDEGIPITPFFLTSFASSLLYYCGLLLLFGGAFCLRVLERVATLPQLDTTNRPFTILSIALFVPALLLWMVVQAVI